jgi:hypothetical protein
MACNVVVQKSIAVDGAVGPLTIGCINGLSPNLYLTAFNGIRAANYYERVRLTPANQQWLSSWLGRCKPYVSANA